MRRKLTSCSAGRRCHGNGWNGGYRLDLSAVLKLKLKLASYEDAALTVGPGRSNHFGVTQSGRSLARAAPMLIKLSGWKAGFRPR